MNNFFYDLNKRMADLSQPQTLTESAVAEVSYSAKAARAGKDIGKPGKNFEKIAADAGKRYGSKAAGERVAGAVLNKLRHPKEAYVPSPGNVHDQYGDEASPEQHKAYQDELNLYKTPGAHPALASMGMSRAQGVHDRLNKVLAKKPGVAEEGMKESVNADLRGYVAEVIQEILSGAQAGHDMIDTVADELGDYWDDVASSRDAGLKKAYRYMREQGAEAEGDPATMATVAQKALAMLQGTKENAPMTAKQKSFAALAPPKDKITFADKIAGAKKEVDEMLGDVAAEAMKNALVGGQKKLDKNKNGRLDAQDFEMLRKGAKQETDEGWDEMERDVKRRMGPKVGDVRRGARHDIETTATGVKATRRYDDEEDDKPTGEKRKAGRPKGPAKGPERVTAKATKHKGGRVKEDGVDIVDRGEYDQEGAMAKDDIKTIVRHAQALEKILGDNDNLPEWVQAKLAKIEGMMTAVDDYMQNQQDDEQEIDEKAPPGAKAERMVKHIKAGYAKDGKLTDVEKRKAYGAAWKAHNAGKVEEESTDKEDQRAERAGRKVAKDIEYDEGHKGKDDARAEKAGKRVTKDIEYDDKKDRKEKKVDETTTSGSVAAGGDAPKKGKGGLQIGKGIYDSMNRELENMIAESMSVNVSMTNDDSGSHKNITVTAADEDAEMLAQLLARAGLTSGAHGHQEPCPDCGSTDCGCSEAVDEAYGDVTATENQPDWPTDTEYSDDAFQYSGGLNKPKTTIAGDGQTTIPVTAVQVKEEDAELARMIEMAGIDQSKLKPWERTMKEEETVEEAAVEEGVVDKVKDVVKKGLEKLGHGSDEEMIKDLQKKIGVPPTGKKPEDKKMEESLMAEFANFKI